MGALHGGTRPTAPLDIHFNVAVMAIANRLFPCGWDVSDDTPTEPTLDWLNDHIARTGRIVVWSGGSNHTIFDSPEHNYAFRAWHDWCHWKGQHGFTMAGEAAVAEMQKDHLRQLYAGHPSLAYWCEIIDAEVIGQNLYNATYGEFPGDQMAFVKLYLQHPGPAALAA